MLRGSCACGEVRYEVDGAVEEAHHCHCGVCRKSHGAAFATFARVRAKGLRVASGSELLTVHRSTPQGARTFCGRCGSSLFFAHDAAAKYVWLAAGTLDGDTGEALRPDAHTFVGSKASWWSIADDLAQHPRQRPEYGG